MSKLPRDTQMNELPLDGLEKKVNE